MAKSYNGRTIIYADVDEVDASNVADVLKKAVEKNETNVSDIEYLYDYYKGKQPILDREKDFNDNILNTVVENHANEIVSFKTGYFLSAPIQYIDAGENVVTDDLKAVNTWLGMESKEDSDLQIAEWFSICGTAFRLILPKAERADETDSPFEFFTLDPRTTFVVYSSKLGHKPLMGVTFVKLADEDKTIYYVYTNNQFFTIEDDKVVSTESHTLGVVPIIEYPANNARIGDFEIVLGLLDAINNLQSDRADGVEQFIQSILCLENMQLDSDSEATFMQQLKETGGLFIPEGAKAYYLSQQLNQGDTQTFKDDLYKAVLYICGIPSRNDGDGSTSDTGAAVLLRNGYALAEARAKNTEICFKKSERRFLNLVLFIANTMGGTNLLMNQVEIRFPRRNYTNDSAKVTNLVTMLSNDWIAPQQAFEHSDMFPDPDAAFMEAKKWHDEQEQKQAESLMSSEPIENTDEV